MYCEHCKVEIEIPNGICPFCKNELKGEAKSEYYPKLEKYRKLKIVTFSQVFMLLFCLTAVITLPVDFVLGKGNWSILTLATMLTLFVFVRHTCFSRNSLYTRVIYLLATIFVLLILYDALLKLDFLLIAWVIPFLLIAADVCIFLSIIIIRNKQGVLQMIAVSILSIPIPLILNTYGSQDQLIPSICSFVITTMLAIAVGIFLRKILETHLKKGFSID